jgi:TatD DNase family protein
MKHARRGTGDPKAGDHAALDGASPRANPEAALPLFDVHAHLTHPDLLPQVDAVLERARAAGLTTIVTNGLNPKDNEAVLELARHDSMVKPALGLYPVDAVLRNMREAGVEYPGERETWDPDEAVAWVERHVDQAFAIGEIGLDGYWVPETFWVQQEAVFRRLVRLAMQHDKPVIIHTRKREKRTLEVLRELGATRVNWHCFGGKLKLASEIAASGHYLSIPANARRSESFTRMLETLPRTQLLFETDSPYLGPQKEETNEPRNVRGTLEHAAELWNVSTAAVETQFGDNFERLFRVAP